MTSDGTKTYSWDAENRMIKITYPGVNNFSTFGYDGYGRNISIVETTAGVVTSTKQFVWADGNVFKEERDASGVLTKKFFDLGQMNSATKYFYTKDQLGSIREMIDNSGVVQAQYAFEPYGRVTKISETIASDFGYAGYFVHARSGLNQTRTRAYNCTLGRFLTRDLIGEKGGVNLYAYVGNRPINITDASGLIASFRFPWPWRKPPQPPNDPKDPGESWDDCRKKCEENRDGDYALCNKINDPVQRQCCYDLANRRYDDCMKKCGPPPLKKPTEPTGPPTSGGAGPGGTAPPPNNTGKPDQPQNDLK